MRPFLIVFLAKCVEGLLLQPQIPRRRCRRRRLESAVHALMLAVVLRLAWRDPYRADVEFHPPYGELAQTSHSLAGEGLAVVVENLNRQPELPERRLHHVANAARIHPR